MILRTVLLNVLPALNALQPGNEAGADDNGQDKGCQQRIYGTKSNVTKDIKESEIFA
jgi:hypothetical protein